MSPEGLFCPVLIRATVGLCQPEQDQLMAPQLWLNEDRFSVGDGGLKRRMFPIIEQNIRNNIHEFTQILTCTILYMAAARFDAPMTALIAWLNSRLVTGDWSG